MPGMLPLAAFPKGFFTQLVERSMSLFEWLDLAASLGVDGVELYPLFFESFDAAYLKKVKEALARLKLRMPMMCNSPDLTSPERAAEIEKTRRLFDVTAELGGTWCRVLSGQRRPNLPPDAFRWVVDGLEQLRPHAAKAGIVMVIENHYKDGMWQYPEYAQSHERFLAILDACPWLKVQYDPSNAIVAGEDAYDLLERVVSKVVTMQASDRFLAGGTIDDLKKMSADPQHGYAPFLKHGVIGRGMNDYDRIFSTLARAGYRGWVSIEDGDGATVQEGMANLKASAEFLRPKLARYFP